MVVETMAAGLPIISTDQGSHRRVCWMERMDSLYPFVIRAAIAAHLKELIQNDAKRLKWDSFETFV